MVNKINLFLKLLKLIFLYKIINRIKRLLVPFVPLEVAEAEVVAVEDARKSKFLPRRH